ncbi:hypothetical protein LXL04_007019 [Taraxacum kok-saghyz]
MNSGDLSKIATTFFACNLPPHWRSKDLWRAFEQLGVLVDAFVPGRKDKSGELYGFVRFIKVAYVNELQKKMNEMVVDGRRLRANVSLHPRSKKHGTGYNGAPVAQHSRNEGEKKDDGFHKTLGGGSIKKSNLSYARVLYGSKREDRGSSPVSVVIPEEVTVSEKSWLRCSLIGEMIDLERLSKCLSMVHVYGLGDCEIKYLGGLSVMLIFNTPEVADCFLRNQKINWSIWFAWLKVWEDDVQTQSRAVWFHIKGVPISLWDSEVFARIASVYGKVLIPFDCNTEVENLSYAKVCVLRDSLKAINNQEVEVQFKKQRFTVLVGEDGDWQPGLNEEEDDYTDSDFDYNVDDGRAVVDGDDVNGEKISDDHDGMGQAASTKRGACMSPEEGALHDSVHSEACANIENVNKENGSNLNKEVVIEDSACARLNKENLNKENGSNLNKKVMIEDSPCTRLNKENLNKENENGSNSVTWVGLVEKEIGPVQEYDGPIEIPDLNSPSGNGYGAGQNKHQSDTDKVRGKLNSVRFRDLVSNSIRKKRPPVKLRRNSTDMGKGRTRRKHRRKAPLRWSGAKLLKLGSRWDTDLTRTSGLPRRRWGLKQLINELLNYQS